MADQSLLILHKKADRRETKSNIAIGLPNSLVDEGYKLDLSGNHYPVNMNSTRIPGSDIIDASQDHKRRCFEKMVVRRDRLIKENVEDVKCALKIEVIDDTALIEATAAVSGFKSCYGIQTDAGFRNNPGNISDLRSLKQEIDGKKRRNKGCKKQAKGCSVKCMNEKKFNGQMAEGYNTAAKKFPEGKGQNVFRKACGKVKVVYQRKDMKGLKLEATGIEERQKIEHETVQGKISDGAFPGTEAVHLKATNGNGHENEKESTIQLIENQTVNEKDDGLNPKIDVQIEKNETEDPNVCENQTDGSKKMVYSRQEMEALRFVGEEEQKKKWTEVYCALAHSVAREYTGLVADANNRQMQRYNRVVNCGATRHAILSMPPVLPLCSSSNYRKFAPYGRFGFRVNFH